MLLALSSVIVGLGLLSLGGDRFVAGAGATARALGVPPVLVGLTVVGFATSAPEILVAATASLGNNPEVAVGNAVGSNIANLGLVLGATAVVHPLGVHSQLLRREFPLMFLALLLALVVSVDGALGRADGIVLAVAFVTVMGAITWLALSGAPDDALLAESRAHFETGLPLGSALLWAAAGLFLLLGGANLLVDGAVAIAREYRVPELVIGLTIVAVGTSLPELAASMAAALKGEPDLALGNVIGSNMFNALAVFAVPALLAPTALSPTLLVRDFPVMFLLSAAVLFMARGRRGTRSINRFQGALLLSGFVGYQWLLFIGGRAA